jgi:hypothetical protein
VFAHRPIISWRRPTTWRRGRRPRAPAVAGRSAQHDVATWRPT